MVEHDLAWEIVQTADTIDPDRTHYNAAGRTWPRPSASTERGELVWGDIPGGNEQACAHANEQDELHRLPFVVEPELLRLPSAAEGQQEDAQLHNEGDVTRNYVSYNFQTLRDDVFMLARDGDVTGNRIGPARSSCAIHVGSYNANRESIYVQQQTISAEGMSGSPSARTCRTPSAADRRSGTIRADPDNGRALNPTPISRGTPRPRCAPTATSRKSDDNNAIMAQLLMQGTNYVNFIGRYCWVAAGDHGLAAVVVTERDEPQAVIGSSLHRLAFPDDFPRARRAWRQARARPRASRPRRQRDAASPAARSSSVQARGEYLYAACGEAGLRVFDIAFIDDKGFSERIVTAPVSPLGQRFFVRTTYATAVAAPTTIAPDPTPHPSARRTTSRPSTRSTATSTSPTATKG